METAINKLIAEYEQKISQYDILIDAELIHKAQARRWDDLEAVDHHSSCIAIYLAQRQAYLQAKVDIESLLDHI